MATCITVAAFGSTINVIAAGSRQAWSFARDEGESIPQETVAETGCSLKTMCKASLSRIGS